MNSAEQIRHENSRFFGPTHVVEPLNTHTHTAILLHGRGSTGLEFANELFESEPESHVDKLEHSVSDNLKSLNFTERLPNWRWIFPSSPTSWNNIFEEDMSEWFDIQSLTDPMDQQHRQVQGLTDSICHVTAIIESEIARLGGDSRKVVLGGISQGGAVALMTLLSRCVIANDKNAFGMQMPLQLGGFVGVSIWLPFAAELETFFNPDISLMSSFPSAKGLGASETRKKEGNEAVKRLLGTECNHLATSTPIFLGHGVDDAYVDVELGKQVRRALNQFGFETEWKEYVGAEQEGHWLKEPEEIDDIVQFLEALI